MLNNTKIRRDMLFRKEVEKKSGGAGLNISSDSMFMGEAESDTQDVVVNATIDNWIIT